jgi:threonine dehydrogenase-like Zn-dependent dehydrogenase
MPPIAVARARTDAATHRIALDQAPEAYRAFAEKRNGHIKVQLKP